MIPYFHMNLEYQSGDKAVSDAIIVEAVVRSRLNTRRLMKDLHIQVTVPSEFSGSKRYREVYLEGFVDGFAGIQATLN